ncbi:HAD-superfamily hydrolase, subfamily IIB [candidate division TM7 genomosp. GTL1]|nr:HAD-superfamily hydrolase, subfamily IIB [candidate division TM7 genomosp. GTL1]
MKDRHIKLILTDLDGTVVEAGTHEVSPRVIEAVKAAEAAGVTVSAVTGRYFGLAKNILKVLGFKDLCVFDGGATIANPLTEEIVWTRMLSVAKLKSIVKVLAPYANAVSLGDGRDEKVELGSFDIETITEPANHVWAAVPSDQLNDLLDKINKDPQLIAHSNTPWTKGNPFVGIHITHLEADKYHGVNRLLQLTGVKKENVLAIGDGDNDIPLFRSAGFKVAMNNATERLKAEADVVVSSVEENGFAEAVEQYVLGEDN